MKYLIDKNTLSNQYRNNLDKRKDLCVLQEVLDESEYSSQEINNIKKAGIIILKPGKIHFEQLKIVMKECGNNTNLIDLYTGKGMADVVMIAYILAEKNIPGLLFHEEFIIVTKDRELIATAKHYGITCLQEIPKIN